MTDAQMGLAVATPAIIVMALLLYRMGVLQKGGVTAAVLMSLAIAMISASGSVPTTPNISQFSCQNSRSRPRCGRS